MNQATHSFLACILGMAIGSADAAVTLAQWTFETSLPATAGPHIAEGGLFASTSRASGLHTSAATVYNNPVGNGSTESFSSNNWSTGDYYQFQTSTLGYASISVSFHQTRSDTGPANFTLEWSADGTHFTEFDSYTVPQTGWSSSGSPSAGSIFPFPALASVNSLSNANNVYFRLVSQSTTAAAGTNRVDNFIVSGELISTASIPEPAHSLLGLLLAGGLLVRRPRTEGRPG